MMKRALFLAIPLTIAYPAAAQEVVPGAEGVAESLAAPATDAPAPSATAAPLVMAPVVGAADAATDVQARAATTAESKPAPRAAVSAGEHAGFSRVVVGGAQASATRDGRTVTIIVDRDADIGVLRRSSRVASARSTPNGAGVTLSLDLACDCQVKTQRLADGRLVVDLVDPKPAARPASVDRTPAGKTAVAAESNLVAPQADKMSVDEARKRMIALLQQAADDGIVSVKPGARELTPRAVAEAPTRPIAASAPGGAAAAKPADEKPASGSIKSSVRGNYACLPDAAFSIDGRAVKDDPLGVIETLQKQLAEAEVDQERALTEKLALAYLAVGFGEEAVETLSRIGEDRSLYADLARVAAGKTPYADGLLMGASGCRGAHALWQAAAGSPEDAPSAVARAGDVIGALPARLRGQLATRLAQTLLKSQDFKGARRFHDIAVKSSGQSPELRFVAAKLLAEEGKPADSQALLADLAESASQSADSALGALTDKAVQRGAEAERTGDDLGLLAKAARGTPEEGRAALREATFWADNGSIEAGVFMLRDAARRDASVTPEAAEKARATVARALASDDAKTRLAGLSAYLQERDFLETNGGHAALAELASETAVAFGVPNAGVSILRSAPAEAKEPARLARVALAAGAAETAIAAAAPYADQPRYADLVVQANIKLGRGYAALAAASALADSPEKHLLTADAAWRAGDYQSAARALSKIDPARLSVERAERLAYAAYMSGEATMPAAAEAVLREAKSPKLPRLRALFASPKDGTFVERGKAVVKSADDDLKFIEEALRG